MRPMQVCLVLDTDRSVGDLKLLVTGALRAHKMRPYMLQVDEAPQGASSGN